MSSGDDEVIDVLLRGPRATENFAARVAGAARAPLVLLLVGDLGMGKTTFARGFVRALPGGADIVVQSPTFALARSYPTMPVVHHLDLYRLDHGSLAGGSGLEELGLLDMLEDPHALSLVEWPRDLSLTGVPCAWVRFTMSGAGRRVEVSAEAGRSLDVQALRRGQRAG